MLPHEWRLGAVAGFRQIHHRRFSQPLRRAEQCACRGSSNISSNQRLWHRNEPGLVIDETAPLGVKVHRWSYYTRAKWKSSMNCGAAWPRQQGEIHGHPASWLYGPRDRATIARLVDMVRTGRAKLRAAGQPSERRLCRQRGRGVLWRRTIQGRRTSLQLQQRRRTLSANYVNMVANAIGAPHVTRPYSLQSSLQRGLRARMPRAPAAMEETAHDYPLAVWLMGRDTYFSADKARRNWAAIHGQLPTRNPATIRWYTETHH